jgi:hypothetical protein
MIPKILILLCPSKSSKTGNLISSVMMPLSTFIRYCEYPCLKILKKLFILNFLETFLYHYQQN